MSYDYAAERDDASRYDQGDDDHDERDESPRRPRYGCPDRMCGANDCATCRGTEAALAAEDEAEREPIGMVEVLADITRRFSR